MLLAGVALAAVLGALRSFLMLALSDETVSLQVVLSWVLGGIQTPSWSGLGLLAGASLACLAGADRKSTRLNSSHLVISYAAFCLQKNRTSLIPSRRGNSSSGIEPAWSRSARCPNSPLT